MMKKAPRSDSPPTPAREQRLKLYGGHETWSWKCKFCKERFSTKIALLQHQQGWNSCGTALLSECLERANPKKIQSKRRKREKKKRKKKKKPEKG